MTDGKQDQAARTELDDVEDESSQVTEDSGRRALLQDLNELRDVLVLNNIQTHHSVTWQAMFSGEC